MTRINMKPRLEARNDRPVPSRAIDAVPVAAGALIVILLLAAVGCRGSVETDAYGNFEATDITVSAQSEGTLMIFTVDEGDQLVRGARVGIIDTTQLSAQRAGLLAQRQNLAGQKQALLVQARAARTSLPEAEAAAGVIGAQLETAERELARTERLHADDAATTRELSERRGAVQALRRQLEQAEARWRSVGAQASVPDAQAAAVDGQIAAIEAQLMQVDDRIAKAEVVNPVPGTVLTVVARQGETVQPGRPLYTIADLSTLRLRAYATGDQLPDVRLGMPVDVVVDDGRGGLDTRRGEIISVSSRAEFTPTPIQTRDARAELVYAFVVRVPNEDGRLKVGMPGEVRFRTEID